MKILFFLFSGLVCLVGSFVCINAGIDLLLYAQDIVGCIVGFFLVLAGMLLGGALGIIATIIEAEIRPY